MKSKIKIIIAIISTALLTLCIWFFGPYASNEGDTGTWKPGYASPRQYYEENGEILKSANKIIDGINYTFDDLGNVMQDENDGKWVDSTKYQLNSGVELKSMWYEIDGNLYYFNDKGKSVRNGLIKVNNKQYALDGNGVLQKYFFRIWGHVFGTMDDGAIIENDTYFSNGVYRASVPHYKSNFRGHGHKLNVSAAQFHEDPRVTWKGINYFKSKPEYFFEKDYKLVSTTTHSAEGSTKEDGNASEIVARDAQIYLKGKMLDKIFIYDKTDNSFYSYSLDEK